MVILTQPEPEPSPARSLGSLDLSDVPPPSSLVGWQDGHPPKPRLRGRLHQIAFFVSIPAGVALMAAAQGAASRAGAGVFAVALTGLFGVSAAYHVRQWSEELHRVMRRLDHSMIFVFIAGSYTPVALLALHPPWGAALVLLAWAGAVVGVLVTALRLDRWHRSCFALYLVLGWLAVVAIPQFVSALTSVELALLVAGGVLYTVGAVILVTRRPDPRPLVFGYHELWHVFVVGASGCHFTLVLLLVNN
jgi:hemolysin III